jgi:transposase-like protein
LTPHAENLRSADRPLKVVPAPQSPERLRRELEVIREEIRQLQEMTLELPEIFENKFRQRLRQTLSQQRLLLEENAYLKRKLLELGPATSPRLRPPLLLQPAQAEPAQTESVTPLERQARPGLMQSLRQAWGGLAGGRARATLKGDEPTRDGLADPKHR